MRIISGIARGKRLATFPGRNIRPTPDRVREAIFSMLFSRLGPLAGKTVLDLYAGTGAMGLEALSRGAQRALFVDQGAQAAGILRENLESCGFGSRATFLQAEVLQALRRPLPGAPFDLVFLDPPYGQDLVPKTVAAVAAREVLAPGGLVCAEAGRQDEVPDEIGSLVRIERRLYGATVVHLFTLAEDEAS